MLLGALASSSACPADPQTGGDTTAVATGDGGTAVGETGAEGSETTSSDDASNHEGRTSDDGSDDRGSSDSSAETTGAAPDVDGPGGSASPPRQDLPRVAGVRLRHRIAFSTLIEAPKLDPHDDVGLRAVVMSARGFEPSCPCPLGRFRWLAFRHELFTGRGDSLLRWLGVAPRRSAYCELLDRIVPGLGADRFLIDRNREMPGERTGGPTDAREWLCAALLGGPGRFERDEAFAAGWRAAIGSSIDPEPSVDEVVLQQDVVDTVRQAMSALRERERRAVWLRFGRFGHAEHTLDAVGTDMSVSVERARQIIVRALQKLRPRLFALAEVLAGRYPWEPRFSPPMPPQAWLPYRWIFSWPANDGWTCDDPHAAPEHEDGELLCLAATVTTHPLPDLARPRLYQAKPRTCPPLLADS